ncbi:hypothetical protein [Microvirga brassicacearum]|uniref:Uncharacterized protein n=1 Tax=Microvirga brassicacearum TaxID=2580413 RepID=A0A5N3P7T2_9HYPH|nr:hypothetical protein [Microvirga brassicacearum]KAB0265787.1 hypothetical protein FEZ63_17445 [Microvirga brassicacearum]
MTSGLENASWRRFTLSFAAAAFAATAVLYGFIVALDPFGLRVSASHPPTAIMDVNQRFMYPQIVRSGRFDSAVFGTSTVRLLDPQQLDRLLGGKFANLGMNAATPWEQMQLATLFLRRQARPENLIFGLDETWCDPNADRKKLTFRAFPPWLYDEDPVNDYPELLNLTTLEIAGRVALNRLGLMPERIPQNGYEIFVPDESVYDLAKARQNINTMRSARLEEAGPAKPARRARASKPVMETFPALDWLEDALKQVPASTRVTMAFMPVHAAILPPPDGELARREAACKARVAELGRRHGAVVVDFRLRSPVTVDDSNYWDALHYRIGIASRIVESLRRARTTGSGDSRGFYAVLNPPPQ